MEVLPAYVLGNGPTLPTDSLHLLEGHFTIGVNRILQSGFDPTAVAWCDREIWEEERERMDGASALLLTTLRNYPRRARRHYILRLRKTDHDKGNPLDFCASGSTGTAAARLALALGDDAVRFDPVYLLGMSASYEGEGDEARTNFYGRNVRHSKRATLMFGKELDRLQQHYAHHVWRTDDPADWKLDNPRGAAWWREWLDKRLRAAGAEVIDP